MICCTNYTLLPSLLQCQAWPREISRPHPLWRMTELEALEVSDPHPSAITRSHKGVVLMRGCLRMLAYCLQRRTVCQEDHQTSHCFFFVTQRHASCQILPFVVCRGLSWTLDWSEPSSPQWEGKDRGRHGKASDHKEKLLVRTTVQHIGHSFKSR